MPPPDTGGLVDRYAMRFFTGNTLDLTPTSERELQRILDNPEKRFTKATNLPSDCSKVLHVQVLSHWYKNHIVHLTLAITIIIFASNITIFHLLQIRAGNSLGMGLWSGRIVVASMLVQNAFCFPVLECIVLYM